MYFIYIYIYIHVYNTVIRRRRLLARDGRRARDPFGPSGAPYQRQRATAKQASDQMIERSIGRAIEQLSKQKQQKTQYRLE